MHAKDENLSSKIRVGVKEEKECWRGKRPENGNGTTERRGQLEMKEVEEEYQKPRTILRFMEWRLETLRIVRQSHRPRIRY